MHCPMTSLAPMGDQEPDCVAIVTGASHGIGYETAKGLASRGALTILACRNEATTEQAIAKMCRELDRPRTDLKLEFMHLDLSSFVSTKRFADEFIAKNLDLHILINNAGIAFIPFEKTVDGYEKHFQVNYLSPFLLTLELLRCMNGGSKVVMLTSVGHFSAIFNPANMNGEQNYSRFISYHNSKLYNIMFAYCLQRRVKDAGIIVSCVHPGRVRTNIIEEPCRKSRVLKWIATAIISSPLFKTAEEGARPVIRCATRLRDCTMHYYNVDRTEEPSEMSRDKRRQKQLWEISMTAVKEHLSKENIERFTGVDEEGRGENRRGQGGNGEGEVAVVSRRGERAADTNRRYRETSV